MPTGAYDRKPRKDLTGKRFGRLLALSYTKGSVWACKCDCGKIITTGGYSLSVGWTKSCGCIRLEVCCTRLKAITLVNIQPEGFAAKKELYRRYKSGASKRGLPFLLDLEQFLEVATKCCHYCGRKPSQLAITERAGSRKAIYGNLLYSGVDRKDSSLGYTLENTLPCCRICNRAKSNLSYEIFIEYLQNLALYRRSSDAA
jgi:hypothetical protein